MNNIYDNRIENCQCPCHLHCPCVNGDFHNISEITSNSNDQNPNTEFFSINYNNSTPLYASNNIYNYTYSPISRNQCYFRKIRSRERVKSLKESQYFTKGISNEKSRDICGNSFNDDFNNYNTFEGNKSFFNLSKFYLKSKIKNFNEENTYLNELLSKVPRHAKNPYGSKSYMCKLKSSFINRKYNRRSNDIKSYLKNRNYKGYSSTIMPPNDLDNLAIKNSE